MSDIREKFRQAHQFAQIIADRCDFATAKKIANTAVSYGNHHATVCIDAKDLIGTAQIICAFAYGATMTGLNFYRSSLEDIKLDRTRLVTMSFEIANSQEVK
jgi:uncharacterized protein YjbI with pentapeptide repeats